MAINLDLRAAPAFDKSIVPAYQYNFNRIRDAFLQASMQTSFKVGVESGPWSKTINVLVPYRCDILLWVGITNYVNSTGFGGTQILWDGVALPINADMFWNVTAQHLECSAINEIRAVEPGNHTIGQLYTSAILTSDTNDRLRWSATMFQVA